MTFFDLANMMVRWGFQIKPHHFNGFQTYVDRMLKKGLVLIISQNGAPEAILFYYLTNDYKEIYKKSTWEIPPDDPEGHQIYIDKMVCRHWTKALRNKIKDSLQQKYLHVTEAYYHRAPFDRCVKIHRGEGLLCSQI